MPVFLLRNCAGHLPGPLRTIGAVAVGHLGMSASASGPVPVQPGVLSSSEDTAGGARAVPAQGGGAGGLTLPGSGERASN